MPTFNDKSIQGIIDKVVAELPCIGTVTDKSVQGIIDQAAAAGITDKSVQGIIDQLTGFSCGPVFDPTLAFKWDVATYFAPATYSSSAGVGRTWLSSGGVAYLAGVVTQAPSDLTKNAILLASIRVQNTNNSSPSIIYHNIHLPVLAAPGANVARLLNNTWRGSAESIYTWDSSVSDHLTTRDPSNNYYCMMPAIYKSASYVGAHLVIAAPLESPTRISNETICNTYIPVGTSVYWRVACAAIPITSTTALTKSMAVGIDLFDRIDSGNSSGITEYYVSSTATLNTSLDTIGTFSTLTSGWNNITNPL